MSPSINFADVKGLDPLPVGKYLATIQVVTEGKSKQNNEKLDLQWKIEGGKYDGRIIFDTLTFTEKALFRVKSTLMGLGFKKDFRGNVGPDMLVGKTALITLDIQASATIDEETGEPYPPRNRVKRVAPVQTK